MLFGMILILVITGVALVLAIRDERRKQSIAQSAASRAEEPVAESRAESQAEPVPTATDRDGDGIPNAKDVFESAKAYVATKPIYESRYYQGGYPDDGYGVCTDVVAFALQGAGYDLQKLMNEDIAAHPEDYTEVETPDPKIDFRRVPNQVVYFTHTAESLTTDYTDTEAWQPGDIVSWDHHIGIISDRRNADGIPYVIHHAGLTQTEYEEDILDGTSRYTYVREITGHFRIP